MRLLALLLLVSIPASAGTRTSGDATVTGAMGAGTQTPRASLHVWSQAEDSYGLKVSSPDGTAPFLLDRLGKAGLGLTPAGARLDVSGRGDAGEVGLELRAGNSTSSFSSAQVAFAGETGAYRHNIRTRAAGTQSDWNAIDFYLWTSSDAAYALGSSRVMTAQSSATAGSGGVHVSPTADAVTAQLVVSSGTSYAGGIILAKGVVAAPCFGALKTDVTELGEAGRAAAVRDLMALRPVRFRYKGDPEVRRGYIYEESPESVRDGRGAVVVDERLLNLELAVQAAQGRVAALEKELAGLEGRKR